MIKKIRKFRRLHRFQNPDLSCSVQLEVHPDKSVLRAGPAEVFLRSPESGQHAPRNNDFAVFALCALSMSKNWEITVDFAVTESAVEQCRKIANAYRLWSIEVLAPLRLQFRNVVPSDAATSEPGIICISGGLDSMDAAIEAVQAGKTSSALLVAGADYETASHPGFVELRERVRKISDTLGLDLRVVETNLRAVGFHWDMLHGFNLAFCLHAQSAHCGFGTFAQDNNAIQDLFRMPWGNLNVMPELFSTASFPVTTAGTAKDRVGKLRTVLEFDDTLLEHLSVCYSDRSTGGNCGRCPKCVEMRITLQALGEGGKGLFEAEPDLVEAVKTFKVPRRVSGIRGRMARTAELVDALPDGALRDAMLGFENKLRWRYHALMPSTEKV